MAVKKPEDYKYIRAWYQMRSVTPNHYVKLQQSAVIDNAPLDAVYKSIDGIWMQLKDVKNEDIKNDLDKFIAKGFH